MAQATPSHAATDSNRLVEVERRGKQVMPFSLEQTVHVFTKNTQGGVQQVKVKDTANVQQIQLIRAHLTKIAHEFKQGNFADPLAIHGEAMPGVKALQQARPKQLNINYQALTDGAEISYSTQHPRLVLAIHQWFDAQLSDHARHAVAGHAHHTMHPR